MVPQVGQKIGPYEILGRLGTGGMGLVFSAWDSRLHRDVAIKVLREEYLTSNMRARFLAEARAASRLNHPNICTIFDIGEQENTPYLVMELLKGETLRGRMQQGPISVEDILCVAEDVADALSVAHAQGIIHRDIKPANIVLVSKPGGRFQSKVLDFGLAKLEFETEASAGLTSTGMTVGTVSYMSPEQAKGELIDRRSDLFSLGTVLYEMATGQLPFTAATSALFFVRLLNDSPEPARELNAAIPRGLDQVISTCLQKDRGSRFQSAEDMIAAIRKVKLTAPGSGAEKQSWIARFTGGRKPEYPPPSAPDLPSIPGMNAERVPPTEVLPSPLAVSGNSMIRPVKISQSSGSDPALVGDEALEELSSGFASQPSTEAQPDDPASVQPIRIPDTHSPIPHIILPRLKEEDLRNPSPRLQRVRLIEGPYLDEEEYGSGAPGPSVPAHTSRTFRIVVGVLLLLLAIGASILAIMLRRTPIVSRPPQTMMLMPVVNRTGDSTLGSVVSAGLELSLEQSPQMAMLGSGSSVAPFAGAEGTGAAQRAKSLGATAFILGEIDNEGPTYAISLRVLDANTGKQLGECSGTAASRERIAGAIDSLAANLRSVLGESSDSISHASVPLGKDATADLDALQTYASGQQAQAEGRLFDAMYAYEHAVSLQPQFTQAHLRLAEIFHEQHAELSAASAAKQAQNSAGNAGERTRLLAQAAFALDNESNYPRAAAVLQQLKSSYPYDLACLDALALAQRLQGDFGGALATASQALHVTTHDGSAVTTAELALLALDRTTDAAHIAGEHVSWGASRPAVDILVTFLNSGAGDARQMASSALPENLDAQMYATSVLDAEGQFREGLIRWRDIATRISSVTELASAASFALSHGALDRALSSDCPSAFGLLQSAFALPSGPSALFAQGAAAGLCGDLANARRSAMALNTRYSQAFSARGFYISDLNALILWKSGLTSDALVTLDSAKEFDSLSLTPYLRGLVYLSERQPQMANVEYHALLQHRGAAALVNPQMYPMAQINMARAYAANGDPENAAQSYGRLLTLWQHADQENPLLAEARDSRSVKHPE